MFHKRQDNTTSIFLFVDLLNNNNLTSQYNIIIQTILLEHRKSYLQIHISTNPIIAITDMVTNKTNS